MRITKLRIENFRSVHSLELELGGTTVLIGPNNAGKSAILEAVRILLTPRWGQRGTEFTENDVHRVDANIDPRDAPPIRITLVSEEGSPGEWHRDILADLDEVASLLPDGRNMISLQLTATWSQDSESFVSTWQFLDADGNPHTSRRDSMYRSRFLNYLPVHWLAALRDSSNQFTPRSTYWGRLLKSIRIPRATEESALQTLAGVDARILSADQRLAGIATTIGKATRVAIGQGPGAARLNVLPRSIEEMLRRIGLVLRNEETRPWLPLGHHGQGLQSLAVLFMVQAVVEAQNAEKPDLGVESIFAIEEPEAHLHPQAARTLWKYIQQLPGQKLITTHSPFFAQHVALRDLRIVRLRGGRSAVARIPPYITSTLPWKPVKSLNDMSLGNGLFENSNCLASNSWLGQTLEKELIKCYGNSDYSDEIRKFRKMCRVLPSKKDESALTLHGRRSRGEIFFARHWVLVEGVTEFLILHAVSQALDVPLDDHGISVIDFQQSGNNAGTFATIADAFQIPWDMIIDNDDGGNRFVKQILERGFDQRDVDQRVVKMPAGTIEEQLIADGNEDMLKEILNCPRLSRQELLTSMSRNSRNKVQYASALSARITTDPDLAERMPQPMVHLVRRLRKECV